MFKENKRWSASDTLIGQGTRAEGTLSCQASLRIEGEFRGDIECQEDVVIGESGVARSNISAKEITISGKVYGDVATTGRLTIMASGELHGSALAASLIVQDGGVLSGSCRMERPAAAQAGQSAQAGHAGQAAEASKAAQTAQAHSSHVESSGRDIREVREAAREGAAKERRQAG